MDADRYTVIYHKVGQLDVMRVPDNLTPSLFGPVNEQRKVYLSWGDHNVALFITDEQAERLCDQLVDYLSDAGRRHWSAPERSADFDLAVSSGAIEPAPLRIEQVPATRPAPQGWDR